MGDAEDLKNKILELQLKIKQLEQSQNKDSYFPVINKKIKEISMSVDEQKAIPLISVADIYFPAIIIQDGKTIYRNKAFMDFSGSVYKTDEPVSFMDFIAPESKKDVMDAYKQIMSGETLGRIIEFTLLTPDRKDERAVQVNAFSIMYRGRKALLVLMQDISKFAKAAKQSEDKFRIAIDMSPDAIAISDLKKGTYVMVNEMYKEITGYSKEDIIGKSTLEIGIWADEKDRHELVRLFQTHSFVRNYEARFKTKDGTIKYGLLSGRLIDINGAPHLLSITRDITSIKENIEKQKKLEEQVQRSQRMEAIGTLAGGVAHDFNNLLMAINGNIDILLDSFNSKGEQHICMDSLNEIKDLIKQGAKLTNQLLDFSKGGQYEIKTYNINELLKKELLFFKRTRKDIIIKEDYTQEVLPVNADKHQIERVFLNLLLNAGDAMPNGGTLKIKTYPVRLNESEIHNLQKGYYIVISIEDNGTGMDEATISRIFEPFFTTKDRSRGTGLGLASSYAIIENHGGYIDVKSKLGSGTCFYIYLPLSDDLQIEEEQMDKNNDIKGKETILMVDDEQIILKVVSKILSRLGFNVLSASNGEEAIALYQEHKDSVDLVILDMIMPGMGGKEVFFKLKEIDPDVKVILSSGYSLNEHAKELLDSGCKGFMKKPYDVKDISQKIRNVLDKENN